MLWYKAWLDTRWRFSLTLVVLLVFACGTVMSFPMVQKLVAQIPQTPVIADDDLQQEFSDSLEAIRTFTGYAWTQWFAGNFVGLLTLAAALLGAGSPLVKSGSGALFSLALPASRERWIGTRAGLGLAELFVLALAPSIAFAVLAPLVDQHFSFLDAVVYGLCAFVSASVFFAVALLLSTVFDDVWRPMLLAVVAAIVIAAGGMLFPEGTGLFAAMAGQSWFFDASLPWPTLLVSAAAAAGLVYAAGANLARRDF
jgi:hypothetical protein